MRPPIYATVLLNLTSTVIAPNLTHLGQVNNLDKFSRIDYNDIS